MVFGPPLRAVLVPIPLPLAAWAYPGGSGASRPRTTAPHCLGVRAWYGLLVMGIAFGAY